MDVIEVAKVIRKHAETVILTQRFAQLFSTAQRVFDAVAAVDESLAGNVERALKDVRGGGRSGHRVRALNERLKLLSKRAVAEVQHRGLRERTNQLVGRRNHEVCPERYR